MPETSTYDEHELLSRVASGDEQAFRILFHHWQPLLSAYIFRITESKEQTEEIVQDVFLKIWMARETLSEIKSFRHYLFVVTRNKAFDEMKKLLREQRKKREWERSSAASQKDEEGDDLAFAATLIDQAIDNLPPRRREVYLMSRHERLTYQEIADRLNISKESVKTHLKLASESISKYINDHLVEIFIIVLTSIKNF